MFSAAPGVGRERGRRGVHEARGATGPQQCSDLEGLSRQGGEDGRDRGGPQSTGSSRPGLLLVAGGCWDGARGRPRLRPKLRSCSQGLAPACPLAGAWLVTKGRPRHTVGSARTVAPLAQERVTHGQSHVSLGRAQIPSNRATVIPQAACVLPQQRRRRKVFGESACALCRASETCGTENAREVGSSVLGVQPVTGTAGGALGPKSVLPAPLQGAQNLRRGAQTDPPWGSSHTFLPSGGRHFPLASLEELRRVTKGGLGDHPFQTPNL